MATLNDICSLITDGSHFSPMDEGVGYPMLSVKDMREDDFDYSSCKHVGRDAFRLLEANGCKPYLNDVVVAKDGSFLKSAFSIKEERDIALLSSIAILRPKTNVVFPDYLCHYLRSDSVYRMVSLNYITGTALKRIILQGLKKLPISLPSLEEQKKRADTLNTINRIIVQRKKQLQKLDDLVKARFVEMFGDCRTNPYGWETKALGEVAEVGSSKRVFVEELQASVIPFYRGTEIGALAEGKTIQPELFITPAHYEELIEATGKPQLGDLLMPSICPDGRIWIVDTEEPFYFKDGRVLWVHSIKPEYDPVFLLHTLKDRIMTDYSSIASGTTFAELKIFALKQCQVFDVPIEKQKEFVAFIHQTDKSKSFIQQGLEKLETLKKSLMQQYFG